jgi:phosphoglycolate phosphatase
MSKPYKLIVFDWDGTLMDSEARIVNCIHAAARDVGLPSLERSAIRNIIGLGLREAIDSLYPGSDESVHRALTDRYRHHFLGDEPTPSTLFPGSAQTVENLHEAGYLLAVATGKGRSGLDLVLEETGLGHFFLVTRCADETFSKPHPQMLEEVMAWAGVEPGETLMIGDTEYDMQMATNARTDALAVSYGVHARERLLQHDPVGCIDSIGELEGWLERITVGDRTTKSQG